MSFILFSIEGGTLVSELHYFFHLPKIKILKAHNYLMSKCYKKIVILGYYSSIDLGNLCMLKGFLLQNKSSKIYLISFYPSVEELILKKNNAKHVKVVHALRLLQVINLLRKADSLHLILGDSLAGRYGFLSKFFVLYNLLLANLFPKKSILEAGTIFPSEFNLPLLRILLRSLKAVKLRERKMLPRCKKINPRCRQSEDLSIAFLREKAGMKKANIITLVLRNSTPQLVGINRKEFVKKVAAQMEIFLKKNKRFRLVLLPFQFGMRKKVDDRIILQDVYESFPKKIQQKVKMIDKMPSLEDVVKLIGKSKLLVSSRLHPCIFAFILNTRFVAINEQKKIEEFARKKGFLLNVENIHDLSRTLEKIIKY
jgi:polysaccharide pyruvyl transferase WcaK-like protein